MTCPHGSRFNLLAKVGAGLVMPALILGAALGAPAPAAASACAGTGACADAAQLFATQANDGTSLSTGCPPWLMQQTTTTGTGNACTSPNFFGNNCFGNGSFGGSGFGCPGTPIYFPEASTPSAPPSWTYVPGSIMRAAGNNLPCDIYEAQMSNTAVNSGGCSGSVATASALSPNPIGVSSDPTMAAAYPAPASATGAPATGQTANSGDGLSQLISTSLSQFFGENPGILGTSSTASGGSSATNSAPASTGAAAPASSTDTP